MMSEASKAVFLSYAREDTDAARRIAEALRSQGVEVWFDQNELRGGDTWDQKIRRQIDDCTLFLAIISQHTQARSKGYFRLEWKLAVEQTHLLLEGVPFLAPVAIDDTPESRAAVPAEFLRVQWTRLPGGLPSPQFVEQVKRLLDATRRVGNATPMASHSSGAGAPTRPRRFIASRVWRALISLAVAGGVALGFFALRPRGTAPGAHPTTAAPDSKLTASTARKSIAVLPFANLSTDRENESFADGMHDDVITALAKIHDLKVISRTSVMPYKMGTRNLRQIASELGVGSVLEGSVQRSGGRLRMNVQLIDARTDAHLWAENYTEEITDTFALQSRLAEAITKELRAHLSPDERSLIARRPTANPEAYELYQAARRLEENLGLPGTRSANDVIIDHYLRAVAKDPTFALAFAKLSTAHGNLYWFGSLDPSAKRRAAAQAALESAERLAPNAPETVMARGMFEYRGNNAWAQALAHYRVAQRYLPNDADVEGYIGAAYRRLGQWPEALAAFQRAVMFNPRDLAATLSVAETLFAMRRYREAAQWAGDRLQIFPEGPPRSALKAHLQNARYALDNDPKAYVDEMKLIGRPIAGRPTGYEVAMAVGDLGAAEAALNAPGVTRVGGANTIIEDSVTLHRALLAWIRSDVDAARMLAEKALEYYDTETWNYRQQPVAALGKARAHALAGHIQEAAHLAETGVRLQQERDAFALSEVRMQAVLVYTVLGQSEKALEHLRAAAAKPGFFSASELRRDPKWKSLRENPQFEEILKSMPPL